MRQEYIDKAKKVIKYGSFKSKKPLLIVLMGLPGTGKSYLGNYLHKKYSFSVLSGENITYALFNTEKCLGSQYREAYEILRSLASELLKQNYNVIIDGTNLRYEFRKQIYDVMKGLAKIVLIYLFIDDRIALKRANMRGENFSNSNTENILSKCSPETFTSFKTQLEPPQKNETFYKIKSDKNLFKKINKIITDNMSHG
jgi:hypothetical protein